MICEGCGSGWSWEGKHYCTKTPPTELEFVRAERDRYLKSLELLLAWATTDKSSDFALAAQMEINRTLGTNES